MSGVVHLVTVSLSAFDTLSGVAELVYSLDKGITWHLYMKLIIIIQDVVNTISYRSTDDAENMEAIQTLNFNMDTFALKIKVILPEDGGEMIEG